MKCTVEITPSQFVGWHGIAEALASSGLVVQVVETSPNLRVTLDWTASEMPTRRIAHSLEAWIVERGLPLLPEVVNDGLIALRPAVA
jgi:hypothetical protein